MKLKLFRAAALVAACVAMFTACSVEPSKLDMKSFLAAANEGEVYPSEAQLAMLEQIIPQDNYVPFPSIDDREYWDAIAESEGGRAMLAEGLGLLDALPEVPISDEIYRRANLEGNRAIYKPRYYRTMDKLERFLLAECIQNKGTFLPKIDEFSRAILAMKSWVHPNHDDNDNGVLEGRRVTVDLGARKFGFVLALVDITLTGDRLATDLRADIEGKLQYRIIDSYLNSCSGKTPKDNTWMRGTSNWNSVCTSGSLLTIMTKAKSREEILVAVGSAINSMKYYVSGFGEDGYCSEGLGYWNYGFGHYLYLAEILYDYSDGAIDLFEFDNPEKMTAVGNFPANYELHGGFYAPFADGVSSISNDYNDNFAYLFSAKHYGAAKPTYFMPDESVFTVIGWRDAEKYTQKEKSVNSSPYYFFDDCGIVISRGTQKQKFSIAIKAGHNNENHNHNDVGSYFIVLDKDMVAGDIGAPSYVAGAFSDTNPARSSWGHPVPRINDTVQPSGREYHGEIIETEFKDNFDMAKLNLLPAYVLPQVKVLERVMTNDKSGSGVITITDSFEASEPVTFGTAIMVNVKYEIEGNSVILHTGEHKVRVDVKGVGGDVKLLDEPDQVKSLRSGRASFRIGADFTQPLTKGSIEVSYHVVE